MYGLRLTLPVNLAGLPAVALPVPRRDGPPASLQLVGRPGSDAVTRARTATKGVHSARAAMIRHAGERQTACLEAHEAGMSIRRLAVELGVSPGAVQRVIETARSRREGPSGR